MLFDCRFYGVPRNHQLRMDLPRFAFFFRRQIPWFWAVLVAVLIIGASSRSSIAAPVIKHVDKLGHFLVYGLFATLVYRAMVRSSERGRAWHAFLLVSAFGASDEWHQSFVPGRSCEVGDWVADTAGAALAVGLYVGWAWYRRCLEGSLWGERLSEKVAVIAPSGGAR